MSLLCGSPELLLAEAVSKFKAELSPAQKQELDSHRSRTPSIDDVMRLTAEIDRASVDRVIGNRRCYGPRLTNFLQGVQQFAKVADIAVGGSQIPIAAGAWAVVRFLLLVGFLSFVIGILLTSTKAGTNASDPYIDKLSRLFSRTVPRFQEMAILYPRSQYLQHAMLEYYIVLVDMCRDILTLSKSRFAKYWTDFAHESYAKELNRCAINIDREVYLENSKVMKEDSEKNSLFRTISLNHIASEKQHRERVTRKQVLDACSTYDHQTTWKQARKLGTTLLFNESKDYLEWRMLQTSCTLLYSGRLGSGKTVLLANIVDDLHLQEDPTTRIAYFFCRYDLPDSLKSQTIIGSLARQLLQHYLDLDGFAMESDLSTVLTIDDLMEMIIKAGTGPIRFVLDGIDDCSPETRYELISSLQYLQQHVPLLLCVGTRMPDEMFEDNGAPSRRCLYAQMPLLNPDIDTYIDNTIEEQIYLGNLVVHDDRLVEDIKETLRTQAQGMFLWVYLEILCLTTMETDHDIREALDSLPKDLSETYNRLLHQTNSKYRKLLFELVLVAQEPLTLAQMENALSVEPGNTQYIPSRVLNSIERVVRSCAGLIFVDDEEETIRLVHQTAYQFLVSSAFDEQIDLEKAQTTMAEIILTYLNYSLFETQITVRTLKSLTMDQVPVAMIITMIPPLGSTLSQRPRRRSSIRIHKCIGQQEQTGHSAFGKYAQAYWDFHLMQEEPSQLCMKLIQAALAKKRVDLRVKHNQLTPLQRSVTRRHTGLISVFLRQKLGLDDRKEALRLAARLDHAESISLLMSNGFDFDTEQVLFEAITNDCPALFQALLKRDPGFNSMTTYGSRKLNDTYSRMDNSTPLMYALACGSIRMIKTFLEDSRVDLYQWSKGGTISPLAYAISLRSVDAVRLFSTKYKRRNWTEHYELWSELLGLDGQSTHDDASPERTEILHILLENNCIGTAIQLEPGTAQIRGKSPLIIATERGMYETLKILLDFDDSNINQQLYRILIYKSGRYIGRTYWTEFMQTAWDLAATQKIKGLLEQHGGKHEEHCRGEYHFKGYQGDLAVAQQV